MEPATTNAMHSKARSRPHVVVALCGLAIACGVEELPTRAVPRVPPLEAVPGAVFPATAIDCDATFSFTRDPVTGAEAGLALTDSGWGFYSYRPTTSDDENAPLIVVQNGGATSEIMLPGGTGPTTVVWEGRALDSPMVNEASWTHFAHVLYLDVPTSGYGYALSDHALAGSAAHAAAEQAALVIAFLECRADRPDRAVVLAGESMAGVRTALMLWHLRHPDGAENGPHHAADWTAGDQAAFSTLVRGHFSRIAAGRGEVFSEVTPEIVARQFFGWVLIQPGLPSWNAQRRDQLFTDIAARYSDLRTYGEVPYDLVDRGLFGITDPEESHTLFGVDLAAIPALAPSARELAFRSFVETRAHFLDERLGPLREGDAYYGGGELAAGNDEPNSIFAENLRWTTVFLTDAEHDRTVASYAIPELLEREGLVASSMVREGWIDMTLPDGETVLVRFPRFDARHVVAFDRPVELSASIEEWLAEIRSR